MKEKSNSLVLLFEIAEDNFWIGITDQEIEGEWQYYPSEEQLVFSDWNTGYPKTSQTNNCAAVNERSGYRWFDDDCTKEYNAICEQP